MESVGACRTRGSGRGFPFLRGLAIALAAITMWTALAVGLHHHDANEPDHGCAICAVSHAPATLDLPSVPAAPQPLVHRVVSVSPRTPLLVRWRRALSNRAPPTV